MWAIGVIGYEMIHGNSPYGTLEEDKAIIAIVEDNINVDQLLNASHGLKSILKQMLNKDTSHRCTAMNAHSALNDI